MQAIVFDGPGQVSVRTLPTPLVAGGEVLVKVHACGICGTDLHAVDGQIPAKFPLVPGHEFAGEVASVGPEVTSLKPGMRVVIDPALSCGHCEFCLDGRSHLCTERGCIGGSAHGAFAEFVSVPYKSIYHIPDHVSYEEAALTEPLSCVTHGLEVLSPKLGDSFLVLGAGTTGLLFVQLALHAGASRVSVVSRSEKRLAVAKQFGASLTTSDLSEAVESYGRYDCVVDVTGVVGILEAALRAVRPGGKLLLFGVAPERDLFSISPYRIYRDEITVVGTMGIHNTFGTARDLIEYGAIDARTMVTHTLKLSEFTRALEIARGGESIKVQIVSE